ncbi:MAG: hypothetical protein ACPG9N_00065 [Miltoncostaeaceae bacterium]
MAPPELTVGIDVSGTRIAYAVYAHPGLITVSATHRLTAGRQYELIREALREARGEAGEPGAIGIEQPHFGFPKAAYMHGMAVARTEDACRAVWRHAPVRFFQPSEWRRIAGVGGRASKERVMEFVKGFGFKPKTQDEADAAAVALAMWVEEYGD